LREKEQWQLPSSPKVLPVKIVPMEKVQGISVGFWISDKDAQNLANNVDELKAYIQKLEIQIEKMEEYYGRN
jgi:hypothetical protein